MRFQNPFSEFKNYDLQQRSIEFPSCTSPKSRSSPTLRCSSNKVQDSLIAAINARHCLLPRPGSHGIVAERRATRADPAAQVRQRQFRAAVELVGAAFGALGDAHPSAGSGRGQGHRGATSGAPGQALTDSMAAIGFRRGRGNSRHLPHHPRACLPRRGPVRRWATSKIVEFSVATSSIFSNRIFLRQR